MKILFLFISYPDVKNNSSMYTDLTGEFLAKGHSVYVAVGNSREDSILKNENGVIVLRVKTLELFNTSFIKKGIANILLPFQILKGIRSNLGNIKFEAIIISTPPITYLGTVRWLKNTFNSKVYLILRDIFPQNAKDLGIIRSGFLFKYFRNQEVELYRISDYIGCMSPGNIKYIKQHNPYVPEHKLHLLPNWTNISENIDPDVNIRLKFGLADKFVALYGGNLGKPQDVGLIIDLAYSLRNKDDIVFLIAGDGTEKKMMIRESQRRMLTNIKFIDPMPRKEYQNLARVCDIGLVNLSRKMTIPNIPSRTLSYWDAKIPVLAAIDGNTDFSHIIEESGSGLWCLAGDLESYIKKFNELYQNKDLRRIMGENGHRYLEKNCTTEKAYLTIVEKISNSN